MKIRAMQIRAMQIRSTLMHAFFSLMIASVMVGCSNGSAAASSGSAPCKDPLTGKCVPCPGTNHCVDPDSCVVIACGGDTNLFGDDSSATGAADSTLQDSAAGTQDSGEDTGPEAADIAEDTGPVDTAPPKCKEGQKSCNKDGSPQFCAAGSWLKLNKCGSGLSCKDGQCTCAKECLAIGQQKCIGTIDAIKKCKLVDGCLLYGVPEACAPGDVCVDNACVPAPKKCEPPCPKGHTCSKGKCIPPSACTPPCSAGQVCDKGTCVGTLSCGQIHACVGQFSQGPNDKLTVAACKSKGTAAAQALYTKRKDCIALACSKLIDAGKINEAMLCIYSKCGAEQAGCIGSGTKTCSQLGTCLTACGTSVTCTVECHASSSIAGVKEWYTLTNCGDQFCKGLSGNAWAQCTTQKCKGAFDLCFGTGGGGGGGNLNCKQILQCAGTCKTKACASACKAKGSAQGQADLATFLTCQKKYCDVFCAQGTAQQCNACIVAYCGPQDAICGYTKP